MPYYWQRETLILHWRLIRSAETGEPFSYSDLLPSGKIKEPLRVLKAYDLIGVFQQAIERNPDGPFVLESPETSIIANKKKIGPVREAFQKYLKHFINDDLTPRNETQYLPFARQRSLLEGYLAKEASVVGPKITLEELYDIVGRRFPRFWELVFALETIGELRVIDAIPTSNGKKGCTHIELLADELLHPQTGELNSVEQIRRQNQRSAKVYFEKSTLVIEVHNGQAQIEFSSQKGTDAMFRVMDAMITLWKESAEPLGDGWSRVFVPKSYLQEKLATEQPVTDSWLRNTISNVRRLKLQGKRHLIELGESVDGKLPLKIRDRSA